MVNRMTGEISSREELAGYLQEVLAESKARVRAFMQAPELSDALFSECAKLYPGLQGALNLVNKKIAQDKFQDEFLDA